MNYWNDWKYKNLILSVLSILFAVVVFKNESLHNYLLSLNDFGYIGVFIAGLFFVSTFTAAPSIVVLLVFAEKLSLIEIGLIAGLGAVAGDFLIFRFVKTNLLVELESIYEFIDGRHHLIKVLHSRYYGWVLPVIGAIIIASPFPDEIGVSLLGISKMGQKKFFVISFILNAVGIILIILTSSIIKP